MMKWIRVDDWLPELSGTYHVIWEWNDGFREYGTAEFGSNRKEWADIDGNWRKRPVRPSEFDAFVTHWLHFEYPPMPDNDYDPHPAPRENDGLD